MTFVAYLTISNRRLGRSGWYTFYHIRSSGHLLATLQRIYKSQIQVKTLISRG